MKHKYYLGDGLYLDYDGYMLTLTAPRRDGNHYVCLEPDVFSSLLGYVEQIYNVKITVEKLKKPEGDND